MPRKAVDRLCPPCGQVFGSRGERFCSKRCYGRHMAVQAERDLNVEAFNHWSPEMAYALGLLYTDGSVGRAGRSSWKIQFYNTDKDTVLWLRDFLGSSKRIYPTHRGRFLTCYQLTVSSPTIGERVQELGVFPRKSYRDDPMPTVPPDVFPHFLRGLIDGDGSCGVRQGPTRRSGKKTKTFGVTFSCNSSAFRTGLEMVLLERGIRSSSSGIHMQWGGAAAERICVMIYKDPAAPRMERKYQSWVEWQEYRRGVDLPLISERLLGQEKPWHSLLGTMPDSALARELGLSQSDVSRARRQLGIPSSRARSRQQWVNLVGTKPDAALAQEYGVNTATVWAYRKGLEVPSYQESVQEQVRPLLGKVPDRQIARDHDISLTGVKSLRAKLKIPPYSPGAR